MTATEKTRKIPVLIAGIIGWAHDGFALVLVSLLGTTISAAYSVDKIAIGFVFSAQYVMTVPGAMIFGELADRFGRKNILLLSVLWDSIFTSLSAIAPTFEIFAILRLISGLGVSWGISFSLLSETFSSERRGAAGGLVHATFVLGYIGAVIVTMIFRNIDPISLGPLVLEGWRICFLSALFPIPFLIYLEFSLDESQVWSDYKKSTQVDEEVKPEKVRVLDILKGKWLKFTLLLTLLFWLSEFAYHTLADWAPTYFEYLFTYELQKVGGDVDSAGTLAMVVMLGVMVIAAFALFTTGWLSDRIGRRNAFIGCSVIGLIGASIFFISNFLMVYTPLIIIGCLVLTISFGMHGVFGVWSSEVFPTRFRATATSIIFSVARGLAWGAFLVGIVAEILEPAVPVLENPLGYAQALAVAMLACTFAYLIMLVVPRLIPETKGIDISTILE
ncbi:MAG: MFS transporter [Candidatus Thorarchaeota archaeon]